MDIVLWAAVAALALVGEVLTVSLFPLFFSLGAVVGLAMALLGFGPAAQMVGFIAVSVASMAVLRPALLNRLALGGSERYEGRGGIVGENAVVTEAIEPGGKGTVRIGGGEFWTARALYSREKIEKGARVRVIEADGLTALVETLENGEGGKSWPV